MRESRFVPIKGGSIGAAPVTLEEFARFVREERYFDSEYWEHGEGPPARGGDEVLRRIGYTRRRSHEPVRSVTWYEAEAYCRSQGGRLPYLEEWRIFDERVSRTNREHWPHSRLLGPWAQPRCAEDSGGESIPEWCQDWYNPAAHGAAVNPGSRPRRRVVRGRVPGVVPSHAGANAGFRVFIPTEAASRSSRSWVSGEEER